MKDFHVIEFILNCLKNKENVVLAIVVNVEGSTPGKPGFKMAIAENGSIKGSIGGGVSEFELVEDIKKYFTGGKKLKTIQLHIFDKNSATPDDTPVCGGQQTVVTYECKINEIENVKQLIELNSRNLPGIFKLSPAGIAVDPDKQAGRRIVFESKSDNDWNYEEQFSIESIAYIIGGGHVGLALSRVLATLDFHIVVIDDRKDINTITENSYAHQIICEPYQNIDQVIPDNENSYIIIMTAGHKADELVLEKLVHKKYKYIGMMGSRKKVPHIFTNLRNKGISSEVIKQVHAPIGIQIKSHTPAEIAISIAAELIKINNS